MGTSLSRPFRDLSKEEISFAVADLGDRYKEYCDALNANGVDGSLLETLDESEIEETLDDLEITNRLHRRVLMRELDKAKSSKDFVSTSYDYGPSTPTSDLEAFSQIAETCFHENRKSAVMAGVHLILNNGNQLSLDTKIMKDGQLHSKKLSIRQRLSICSNIVNDGRDQVYYKIEIPLILKQKVFEQSSAMTYTGHILRDESGKRVGVVCMVDRCPLMEIIDSERKEFLYRMAQEAEQQLKLRRQLLEKQRKVESQSIGFQKAATVLPISASKNNALNHKSSIHKDYFVPAAVKELVLHTKEPMKLVTASQMSPLHEIEGSVTTSPVLNKPSSLLGLRAQPRAQRKPPVFQELANEDEKVHLASDVNDLVDQLSAPRPPIAKNDMERCAAVEALGMTDIGPEDEIALHLKSMVKMAKQVFEFPQGQITFINEKSQYRIATHGDCEEIVNVLNSFFQPVQCNKDGSRFLCKMSRGLAVCNYVLATGQTFVVQDLAADERFRWMANISPLRSYVGTPIKDSSGQVIAILCLFDKRPRPDFEAAHEIQIEQFAFLISQSIENWALTRAIERLNQERQAITQARSKTAPPKDKATIVLTDIQGSTALWESDAVTMQESQDLHDNIIRQVCAAHWGYEIETEGDAFTLAFHDPVDAFGFALKAQKALFDAQWPVALLKQPNGMEEAGAFRGLRVRMAIHHGCVESSECEDTDRIKYTGETMNLAKSLITMAQGGQILSSAETWEVAYYFMGSVLGYPQVLDLGSHVVRKGKTFQDGLITKRIIQLVPTSLAYDYFAARKLAPGIAGNRSQSCALNGRQFPPLKSLKAVSASFHDAPFNNNEATIAFVNLSAVDDQEVSTVTNLIGKLLDGSPELGGYQCQSEMLVFHQPVDAIVFGLLLKCELERKARGSNLAKLIKYGCIHDAFLTMGPHRSTGRADYFGKIVNRAARLSSVAAAGSVYFGIVCSNEGSDAIDVDPINDPNIKVSFLGRKALKGIQEEISVYECASAIPIAPDEIEVEN